MFTYIVLLLILNVSTAVYACPDGFVSHTGSCYALLPVKASWVEAKTYCAAIGAKLAVIKDSVESNFVHGYLQREHSMIGTTQIWIGGTDLLQEGTWLTPDNREPLTFFNWAPSEPDNLGGQHCLAIFNSGNLEWGDSRCGVLNYALCKLENYADQGIIG